MKFHAVIALFLLSVLCSQTAHAQTEYKGSMVIFFRDSISGLITVSLDKPNAELIPIVTVTKTKTGKGKERVKSKTTRTAKWNAGAISALYVNKKRYVFRDLKDRYGDSTIRYNCTVTRVAGTDSMGLFLFTDPEGGTHYYIQTPNDGRQVYNIEHPYVAGSFTSFAGLRFTLRCPAVAEKISAHDKEFVYAENGDQQQKVQVWKNIIASYYAQCKK